MDSSRSRRVPRCPIAQLYANFGHRRTNQTSPQSLDPRTLAWFKRHLQDRDVEVSEGVVEAPVQTCSEDFGERHRAETWRGLSSGAVRLADRAESVVRSDAENPRTSRQIDPRSGQSENIQSGSCRTVPQKPTLGTASSAMPATEERFTLTGSPTVIAHLDGGGRRMERSFAPLWDVAPQTDVQTFVTQALVRLDPETSNAEGTRPRVLQLHANAYSFDPGHRAELQILGRSTTYVEPPAHAYIVRIARLDVRLPVADDPNLATGVQNPAPRVLPDGFEWAPRYGPNE